MIRDSAQFGSFCGLDNRRELMRLMVRLGEGLPDEHARRLRARFLQSLLPASTTSMAGLALSVTPCSAVEGYHLLVAITGCLGVPIDEAAARLERLVRSQ